MDFLVRIHKPGLVLYFGYYLEFLLLAWPPVRVVCLNYELAMLQPRTVIPPYLGSVVNCYIATPFFLTCFALLYSPPDLPLGGGYHTRPWPLSRIIPQCSHTGSFSHLGITCLRPIIRRPIAHCPIL